MCSREDDPSQHDNGHVTGIADTVVAFHTGPVHKLADKRTLAIHLGGVPHLGPDGNLRRVVSPGVAVLSRWRLDELQEEHRRFHEGGDQ